MKKQILNSLPVLITIVILLTIYIGMRTITPGDELAVSILYFGMLIPACAIFAGVWYGFRSQRTIRWITPLVFFCLEVVVVCTSSGQMTREDYIDYLPMGLWAAIPCLVAMVIGTVIGHSLKKRTTNK